MELIEYLNKTKSSHVHKGIANKLLNLNISTVDLTKRYDAFIQHRHLMRQNDILFENFFKDCNSKNDFIKGMEKFDDAVYASISKNKAKKLLHSVISNKYKHLINEDSERIFETFVEEGISRDAIQNGLTKKIARIEDEWEFNQELNLLADSLISWDKTTVLNKIKRHKLNLEISDSENVLVVKCPDFKTAKLLGSRMWCITQSDNYFQSYTKGLEQFYFQFDFNKQATDISSFNAFIVDRNNKVVDGYARNDSECSNDINKTFERKYQSIFTKPTSEYVQNKIQLAIEKEESKSFTFGMFRDDSTDFFRKIDRNAKLIEALNKDEKNQFLKAVFDKTKDNDNNSEFSAFSRNNLGGLLLDPELNMHSTIELLFSNEHIDNYLEMHGERTDAFDKLLNIFADSHFKEQQFPLVEGLLQDKVLNLKEIYGFRNVYSSIRKNPLIDIMLYSHGIKEIEITNDSKIEELSKLFHKNNKEKHSLYISTIDEFYDENIQMIIKRNAMYQNYKEDINNGKTFDPNVFFKENKHFASKDAIEDFYLSYFIDHEYNRDFNPRFLGEAVRSNISDVREAGLRILSDKNNYFRAISGGYKREGLDQLSEFKDMIQTIRAADLSFSLKLDNEADKEKLHEIVLHSKNDLKKDIEDFFNNDGSLLKTPTFENESSKSLKEFFGINDESNKIDFKKKLKRKI